MNYKSLLFLFLLILVTTPAISIKKRSLLYSKYVNPLTGKEYPISLNVQGDGRFIIMMEGIPVDSTSVNDREKDNEIGRGGILVMEVQFQKFRRALELAKMQFESFIKDSKPIKSKKSISTFCYTDGYFKNTNGWHFSNNITPYFYIRPAVINDQKKECLYLATSRMDDIEGESNFSHGFEYIFSTPQEVEDLLSKLNKAKIEEFIELSDTARYMAKLKEYQLYKQELAKNPNKMLFTLGIKAGYRNMFGINNFSNDAATSGYTIYELYNDYYWTFHAGCFARFEWKKFCVQPEISILNGTVNYDGFETDRNTIDIKFKRSTKFNALEIPLLLGFRVFENKYSSLNIFAGPKMYFDINSSTSIKFLRTYGDTEQDDLSFFADKFKLGFEAGAEFDIKHLTFGLRFSGMKDPYHSQLREKTLDHYFSNSIAFSIGWKIIDHRKMMD